MAKMALWGLNPPIINNNGEQIREFPSSDPTKPSIEITSIYIDPSSDVFDSTKDYIGLIIYLRDGMSVFTLKDVNCRTGDIYIKESNWIKKNIRKRSGRGEYLHGRLFYSIFGCWKKLSLGFVGGGFSYHKGKWKFNSRTFNTINPNNNNDGYHDTNAALNSFEEELIKGVCNNLYENHLWLQLSSETRVGNALLLGLRSSSNDKQNECSADFSKVNAERELHGTVQWVNYRKGYGFIECLGFDKNIFVHRSKVSDPPTDGHFLRLDDNVKFNVAIGRQGWEARKVIIIESD